MLEKECKNHHGKNFLILVIASIFLVSFSVLLHNAFADTAVISTIPVGNTPTSVAVNPITNMIYVINNTRVFVINGTTNALADTIITGGISSFISNSVDVNPNTNRIYVANYVSNTVSVIDGLTDSIVDTISVTYPMGVKVNPETNMVYVINGGYSVTVINGSTNVIITKITVPGSSGAGPNGIVVNANTNKIYVSSTGYDGGPIGYLSITDGASNSLLTSIKIGASGGTLGVNPSVNRIYMTDVDGILFVIDGYTNSIISMAGFDRAAGIGVDQVTDKIYLANYASNTVSVIDGQTNTVTSQVQVGSNPLGIGVDAATNKIYTANSGSATVSVIDGSASSATNTVPTAPQNLQATAGNAQVTLSWMAPSSNGGSPITNYNIYRGTTSETETFLTTLGNATSYNDTTVTNGQTYFYKVTAVNSIGESVPSNEASATPKITIEFSSDTSFTGTVNASDTLIIDPGVTLTSNGITNYGNITNHGTIQMNNTAAIDNHGLVLNLSGRGIFSPTVNNYQSGNITTTTAISAHVINNYGIYTTYTGIFVYNGYLNNFATGILQSPSRNLGAIHDGGLVNYGTMDIYGSLNIVAGGYLYNNGTFNSHSGLFIADDQAGEVVRNYAGGTLNNLAGSEIVIPSRTGGYSKSLNNDGIINNLGMILNSNMFTNSGTVNNNGTLVNNGAGRLSYPAATIVNSGTFNNNGVLNNTGMGSYGYPSATVADYHVFNNNPSGIINNGAVITKGCGAVFNNYGSFNGNPLVNDCSNQTSNMTPGTPSTSDKVIATIPVGSSPWNIAVNPDTNRIYVGTNGTEVIDGATNTIIAKIAGVSGADVNPVTNKIYACGANTISVIDGNTDQVVTIIPVGAHCGHLAVNPVTNKIYVDSGTNSFSVIDGNTNQVVKTISIPGHPYDIAVNPDTNRIYQTSWDTLLSGPIARLSVIDGSTDTVLQSMALGTNAGAVAVNPTTNMIYANNQYIYVINGSTNDVVNKIGGFHAGDYLGINKITNKIYVSDASSNTVSVIDGSNDTVTSTIQVGNVPEGIGVNTNTSKIYVSNFNDKTVSVINGSSSTIPQSPTGLTATPKMPPRISLSWTAPSDNGGSAITGYMIERSTDNGATWNTIVQNTDDTKTTYTDSHLMPVKAYTYRVSAINSIGTSDPSNTVSARPLSAHGH